VITADPLELIGMLAVCGAGAVALVHADPRVRHVAMLAALVLAPVLVIGDVWDDQRVVNLRDRPATVAAVLVAGVAVVLAAAALFRRVRWAFPLAAFVALPLRVPVEVTGQTANLLVPLYVVIAAGWAAAAWDDVAGRPPADVTSGARDDGRTVARDEPPAARWLRWLLAGALVLYAIQSAYSEDVSNAIENACFFLVPFAVLFALLLEVRWDRWLLGALLAAVAVSGVVLAAVAFWQYAARDLLFNDDLLRSNEIHLYFRVNSLFYDPNIFGRYMALILIALAAFVAWTPNRAHAWLGAAAAVPILAALGLSFSITSLLALIAGLLVCALLRFGLRWALVGAAAALLAGGVFLALGGAERSDVGPDRTLTDETSGRTDLVSGGIDLAGERPVAGWGSGAFGAAFYSEIEQAETTASHSEPITVGAEQGAIGLIVYVAMIGTSLALVFGVGSGGLPGSYPGRTAVAACYVAMVVHSLGYAGFLTDPATWALLSLSIGLAARPAAEAVRPVRSAPPVAAPETPAGA
jgi:O-Antigen ligase